MRSMSMPNLEGILYKTVNNIFWLMVFVDSRSCDEGLPQDL